EVRGVNFKVKSVAKVVERIVAGNKGARRDVGKHCLRGLGRGVDFFRVGLGMGMVGIRVSGIDFGELVTNVAYNLAPQLRRVPDMRVIKLLTNVAFFLP